MTYLLLQTFLLLLASFFFGAFVACSVKRAIYGTSAEAPALALAPIQSDMPVRPPIVMPPQPVRARPAQPVAPRAIDPVQPRIEVLRRPEPRPMPTVLDPSRFERALIGPDPNEGVPRVSIVEVRPSVLKPVTGIYRPRPPEPPPAPPVEEPLPEIPVAEDIPELQEPEVKTTPEPRMGGLAARLRDATTAAAAGAVAAAKAAAAASVSFPGMGTSRRAQVENTAVEKSAAEPEEVVAPAAEPYDASEFVGGEVPVDPEEVGETQAEPSTAELEEDLPAEPEPEPDPEPEVVAEPEPEPAPQVQAPAAPAAPIEGGDDFQRVRAIDADIEQKLKARGITYFEHIAGLSASDVRRIGQELEIPGRIDREQWVEQAQILAKGGETYYSRNRKTMLKTVAQTAPSAETKAADGSPNASASNPSRVAQALPQPTVENTGSRREDLSGVAAASQGRSVAEMAAAAAAAIAAASASVTRGLKPIEPISPLSKVDPKISMPARITDAIREKVAASVEITKPDAKPEAPSEGPVNDLKRIRGIGVLIEKRLNAMGISRYDQIANWTSGDIDRVSRMLEFKGRIERESWVEQARILASGGQTEFSRRVDRGEVDTSRET
ncbi:hypothetical protein [Hyphomicrobium sp.]|jgi:predicted flap endonuclease-1-like 5' DNA nuclease|uniref:hypothetical protein n=1 Tax=Hyphomicrobium sp. TaxID=82 RepID=UPI0035677F3A